MFKHTSNSMLNAAFFVQGDPDFIDPAAQRDDHDAHSLLHIEFDVFGQQLSHSSTLSTSKMHQGLLQYNQTRSAPFAWHTCAAHTLLYP